MATRDDKGLPRRVWRRFRESDVLGQSAQLSFYLLLALFPLLLILISMVGLLLQSETLPQAVLNRYLSGVLPESAMALVDSTLREASGGTSSLTLSFALVFLGWSAIKAMRAVIDGLNATHQVVESRPWWKTFVVALALTLSLLLLVAFGLTLLVYGRRLQEALTSGDVSGWIGGVWPIARWLLALVVVMLAFNLAYRYAPDVGARRWRWLAPGTLLGVGLWLLVSFGFQLYVQQVHRLSATYGTIGAVITLLLWIYLSGVAFLMGAAINAELTKDDSVSGKWPGGRGGADPRRGLQRLD